MQIRTVFISAFIAIVVAGTSSTTALALELMYKTARSGVGYHIYRQDKLAMDFEDIRPSSSNPDIQLCIPAAFTTHDNKIDGVYIVQAKIGNPGSINSKLGG